LTARAARPFIEATTLSSRIPSPSWISPSQWSGISTQHNSCAPSHLSGSTMDAAAMRAMGSLAKMRRRRMQVVATTWMRRVCGSATGVGSARVSCVGFMAAASRLRARGVIGRRPAGG